MTTTIHFDPATPAGRAIQHLLDTALADQIGSGLQVRLSGPHLVHDGEPGRILVIHPSMPRGDSLEAAGGLLMLVESLAGTGAVNLAHLYAVADPNQREAIALAIFIAAGYQVGHPDAGRRRAS